MVQIRVKPKKGRPKAKGRGWTPRALKPKLRPKMRDGRGPFLRSLRGKIARVQTRRNAPEAVGHSVLRSVHDYRTEILDVLDKAVARYKGA